MESKTSVERDPVLDDKLHEVCERIRSHMIAELRKNQPPWIKPWSDVTNIVCGGEKKSVLPFHANLRTPGRPYGPMNQLYLDAQKSEPERTIDRHVPNLYITTGRLDILELKAPRGDPFEIIGIVPPNGPYPWGIRTWEVWHIGQLEEWEEELGVRLLRHSKAPKLKAKLCDKILEKLQKEKGLSVWVSAFDEGAYYNTIEDMIFMPSLERFLEGDQEDAEGHYWATLWHEVVHWTGHPSRLGRKGLKIHDAIHYAQEELVAEMGSALLCAILGLPGKLQHSAYIRSWLKHLEERRSAAIFTMMLDSQKAIDWVMGWKERRGRA